jgi:hypothetical protein
MHFLNERWGDIIGLILILSSVLVFKFVSVELGQSFFAAGLLALKLRTTTNGVTKV